MKVAKITDGKIELLDLKPFRNRFRINAPGHELHNTTVIVSKSNERPMKKISSGTYVLDEAAESKVVVNVLAQWYRNSWFKLGVGVDTMEQAAVAFKNREETSVSFY